MGELWEEELLSELGDRFHGWGGAGPGFPRRRERRSFWNRVAKQALLSQRSEMWTGSLPKFYVSSLPNTYSSREDGHSPF